MERNINQKTLKSKSTLRKEVLLQRDQLTMKKINEDSRIISQSIFLEKSYCEANHILIFLSFGTEIDTDFIIKRALLDNKKVYVPRISDFKTSFMQFYEITIQSDFIKNKQGIMEPIPKNECLYMNQEKTLCITPGVVFDESRNRIGYGKGFYDLFFKTCPCDIIAVCFDFQILKNIPTTKMDKCVDKIISERRII